jgi:hypothetical protein
MFGMDPLKGNAAGAARQESIEAGGIARCRKREANPGKKL